MSHGLEFDSVSKLLSDSVRPSLELRTCPLEAMVSEQRGAPQMLFCDNGSEFSSPVMDLWAYHNPVKIDFSRPGKPTDNAHVESFNGTLRAECLDAHWFSHLPEAAERIEAWRWEYNASRPHRALGERTPHEFARQIAASRDLSRLAN
jgi:putative transposase